MEETKTAEEMFKQRQTIIIEQNYPYEKGAFGKLIEKITIGKSRFDDYIVLRQETPMGVNRGSLFIHETKAKEVATAIYPELTQQQSANDELQEWKTAQIYVTAPFIEFMNNHPETTVGDSAHGKAIEFITERDELKKQNEELVEVLTTLTDSNLFSNIVHLNARAGGKKKLAEAWEKALKLLSKHTT